MAISGNLQPAFIAPRYNQVDFCYNIFSAHYILYCSEYAQRRDNSQLLKGSLWLKRDKFFSKWRERFFVITSTFIKCFESESESILLWKVPLFKIHNKVSFNFLTLSDGALRNQ